MTIAKAHVTHCAGNRTRIRVPAHRGDHDYFKHAADALKSCPGIQDVETNALTGSILFLHDAPLSEIGDFAKAREIFELSQQIPVVGTVTHRLLDVAKAFDRSLQQATHGRVNGMEAAALTLLILGFYKLLKSDILPPASTLFWYAAATLVVARRRPSASTKS